MSFKKVKGTNKVKTTEKATSRESTTAEATAEELSNNIIKGSKSGQRDIYEFCNGEHYRVLGFESFKSWAVANREKLGVSYDTLNNAYHTAQVTAHMCGEDSIGEFTPHALLQMKNLSSEECKLLYRHALAVEGKNALTAQDLTQEKVKTYMIELKFNRSSQSNEKGSSELNEKTKRQEFQDKEQRFLNALSDAESSSLSQRIAIAINGTRSDIKRLMICKAILPKNQTSVIKHQLKKLIRDLEQNNK